MSIKVILDADVIADFYKDNRTGIFRVTLAFFRELIKSNGIDAFYSHLSVFHNETSTKEIDHFFSENSLSVKRLTRDTEGLFYRLEKKSFSVTFTIKWEFIIIKTSILKRFLARLKFFILFIIPLIMRSGSMKI